MKSKKTISNRAKNVNYRANFRVLGRLSEAWSICPLPSPLVAIGLRKLDIFHVNVKKEEEKKTNLNQFRIFDFSTAFNINSKK